MMVGQLEGRFLEFLVFLSQARLVVEIGTFTGYSALSMASALPPDGTIVTCDINPETNAIARRHAAASPWGRQDRVPARPRAGDTRHPRRALRPRLHRRRQDVATSAYYEAVLPKLADRGVIVVDNVLWSGRVLDPADDTADTVAIRAFNDAVAADPRVVCVMLTVRDGVMLIRRA